MPERGEYILGYAVGGEEGGSRKGKTRSLSTRRRPPHDAGRCPRLRDGELGPEGVGRKTHGVASCDDRRDGTYKSPIRNIPACLSNQPFCDQQDVRKQLITQCKQSKLLDPNADTIVTDSSTNESNHVAILRSFLTGFATSTARLFPDGSYRTVVGNQTVAIHPSSVLFGRKVEAIMYNEYVYTNRSYARGVSAVQMNWVGEVLGV